MPSDYNDLYLRNRVCPVGAQKLPRDVPNPLSFNRGLNVTSVGEKGTHAAKFVQMEEAAH